MVPRVSLHWVLNSLERGECMDPAENRVEIGPGPETAHQVEQSHLQHGQWHQASGRHIIGHGGGRVQEGIPLSTR